MAVAPPRSLSQRFRLAVEERFLRPARQLDAHQVAYAIAIGCWNGILPLPGLTLPSQLLVLTILGSCHARLGMTSVQFSLSFAMHLVTGMSGLQILLMAPYFSLGDMLASLAMDETTCSVAEMLRRWSAEGLLQTLLQLPLCIAFSLAAWLLSGALLVPLLYVSSRCFLTARASRLRNTDHVAFVGS